MMPPFAFKREVASLTPARYHRTRAKKHNVSRYTGSVYVPVAQGIEQRFPNRLVLSQENTVIYGVFSGQNGSMSEILSEMRQPDFSGKASRVRRSQVDEYVGR